MQDKHHVHEAGRLCKRRLTSTERRLAKLLGDADALFWCLNEGLMRQYRPQRLLLLFGSSVQRPLEAYEFQLPAPAGQCGGERGVQDTVRRVLRTLILSAQETPEGSAARGPTKLFLLLQGSALDEPPQGFLPKRGFQLNIRSGTHVDLQCNCAADAGPSQAARTTTGAPQPGSDDGLVWYQSTAAIKGMRGNSGAAL
eukprot:jgi/Astpho2/3296/Aster-x1136